MDLSPAAATRPDGKALAATATTVVLWASAFVSIRSAADHFGPGALSLGRLATGSVVLLALLLYRREGLPPKAAWPGIVASGVLWFGLYTVAIHWGERLVDAGTAAMVVALGPVLIALLSSRLLHEGLPRRLVGGLAVSFAGALVVGVSMSGGGGGSVGGILLCVLAAVTYAAGVVLQKPALRHASPLQVTAFSCATGAVVCLPFAPQLVSQLAAAPLDAGLNVLYLGLFPTALAFTAWAYALARTSAAKLGATTYAVPALVVLMSWAVLGELPRPLAFAGGALCLAGVALSRRG
ncbi:DMT family transporter [Kitasatospora terrestris]|uniref:DMT family transporter n=1 Tax=Kitasatospora terrestris TaxID=258051 RepID=A0ABP9E7M0_9ACTN